MALYNLRSADGAWRITKFTSDLEVESSYTTSEDSCDCPAGQRPTCRHRQMLPTMLAQGIEDSPGFYDFDKNVFLEPISDDSGEAVPTSSNGIPSTESTFDPDLLREDRDERRRLEAEEPHGATVSTPDFDSGDGGSNPPAVANSAGPHPQLAMNVEHPSIGHIKRRI